MKKKVLVLSTVMSIIFLLSCSKSADDDFDDANGDVAKKYIKHVQIIENEGENRIYTVNYGTGDRISSISNGNSSAFFNYSEADELSSVVDDNDTFDIDELYQSPYDAFETGNVIEYDEKANPIKIEVYEEESVSNLLIGDIIYDPNPNPFYYTLKAAGVIDVIDRVDLNFGYSNPSIIKAKQLLPYNNIRAMIFRDESGITKYEVQIDYKYDEDKYPISAVINALSVDETSTYTILYSYK